MFNLLIEVFGRPPERWGTGRQILWNIPFLRNPYFTGRDQTLLRLHRTLAADNTVVLSQTRAISGLGGIGKTQTALEYAHRYANEYEAVLWVRADSHETLVSDFALLALTLDLREKEETDQFRVITAVKRWLQEHGPWLLIFDNADDLAVVSDFLPRGAGGATLLTTRSQITGQHIKKIEMEKMSREEGVTFMLRRITSSGDEVGEEDLVKRVSDMELHAAQELWEVMDGLPLALDQAGAYIEARQCSLNEYLDLYRNHREALLRERGGPIPGHPDAVATTWSLSFQRVQQKNPAAAELLQLCAFLSPDAIPEELIIKGAAHFTSSLQALATSDSSLPDAISTLRAYSLVRRDPATRMLSIHRLVQVVLQDALEETERRSWAMQVVLAANVAFPHPEHSNWSQCERLLPHALLIAQYIETDQIIEEEAGRLLHKTATYLRDRARYTEAEPFYQRALAIREQQLGPQHPDVARSLHGLAYLYSDQSKYGEAEPLYQRALAIREQQLGPQHPDVARSLNNLAEIYRKQGKYGEAEPLYMRALRIFEQQGPEHPLVADPLFNLAELSREQGKYVEAKQLYQRALCIWEQQLGPEHPLVADPLTGLANLSLEQGKYEQAESLYQRALHILEQAWGSQHPDTAETMHGLARLRDAQGHNEEARDWYARALAAREQALGAHHPKTTETRSRLTALLRAMGQHQEAAQLEAEQGTSEEERETHPEPG